MTAVLETSQLSKRYGRHWALSDCTLEIPPGHVVGLVGPNGAGKTTLLHLAVGLLAPTSGTILVLGDRIQLQQVLINLAMNAIEAMNSVTDRPRDLLIRTERDGAKAQVAVIDSGIGVPQEHIRRMFEAFFTTKSSGMGMGLSICRSIIEAHGGRIGASSSQVGGSTLEFSLPLLAAQSP